MIAVSYAVSMDVYFYEKQDKETQKTVEEGLLTLQGEYPEGDPAYRAIECLLEATEAVAGGNDQKAQALIADVLRIQDEIRKIEACNI